MRKQAEAAWHEGKFEETRKLYLQCAKHALSIPVDDSHSLALAYSGAAGAAMNCGKYVLALKHLKQSFDAMRPTRSYFIETFNYAADMLILMRSYEQYLPTEALKRSAENLCRNITGKFKKFLLNQRPPKAKISPVNTKKHGELILDRFLRLEDLSNPQSADWLNAMTVYSQSQLNLTLFDYRLKEEYYQCAEPHRELPYRVGKWFYFEELNRDTNHPTIKRSLKINTRAKAIFSGEEVSKSGSHIASTDFHPNGKLAAYCLTENGSDQFELRVRNLIAKKDIANLKIHTRTQPLFHPDGKGIVYWKQGRKKKASKSLDLDKAERPLTIYYRAMTATGKEKLFLKPKTNKVDVLDINFVHDRHTVLVQEWHSESGKHIAYLKRMDKRRKKPLDLFDGKLQKHTFIGSRKNLFYFRTTTGATRGQIFALNIDIKNWKILGKQTIIAENAKPMRSALLSGEYLIVHYFQERGEHSLLKRYTLSGEEERDISLPFAGFVSEIHGSRGDEIFLIIQHFDKPAQAWMHNLKTGKNTLLFKRAPEKPGMVKTFVEAKSKDGVMVPVWIVHKKGLKISRHTPALMEVYGGFDVPNIPCHSYKVDAWLALGGILVQPYLRGGGELGELWHKEATKENKQKTFDDAIATAQYLIKNGWTSASKLAISGSSNGGLTVAAMVLQKPELFGAAVAANGLFDMLKYEEQTIGWGWVGEYGSTARKKQFLAIKGYSPYHNVKPNKIYPPLLLCVSQQDDRVPPWHSYKLAAALARANNHVLLRLERNAGHKNYGSSWVIRDELAFLKFHLDIRAKD